MSSELSLLFDADDTLWINATLFEDALKAWNQLMAQFGVAPERSLSLFQELEERGFRRGWYGSRRLEINMNAAARFLLTKKEANAVVEDVARIVDQVRRPDVLLFDGVHETLQYLGQHHRLYLVTMGEQDEQLVKIKGSGLEHYFRSIHVLPDKTRRHYATIIQKHRFNRRRTWMIGNSLSKDIRPARAAGLKTCFIDNGHDFNFGLPVDAIEPDKTVSAFHDLGTVFGNDEAPFPS